MEDRRCHAVVDGYMNMMNRSNCSFGCYSIETTNYCRSHILGEKYIVLCCRRDDDSWITLKTGVESICKKRKWVDTDSSRRRRST